MSKRAPITTLADAEPAPWKADKQPEPSAEQTQLFRACATLIGAQEAMRTHTGAHSGPEWVAKTKAYREAWIRFDAVFRTIKGETE